MKEQTEDRSELATGNIPKLLFNMAMPGIMAQIINLLYSMVDRMFIGRIPNVGAQALTGVGITFPIVILIAAFAALVSMGAAPRASIALGEGNKEEAEKILGNSVTALVVVSIVITIIVTIFGQELLELFGASPDTIGYALDYIRIYAFGTIFVQLAMGLNAFITAQGFAKISMITISIGAVLNIILDPILIFGMNLGVKGAAIATIISQAASAFFVLWFLLSDKTNLKIKRKNLKLEKKILLPSLILGLSPFIMQSTESLVAIVFNTSLQKYGGDLAVGTMTILTSVMQFSMMPLVGLTQGSQPIISYNFGARNYARVRDTFKLLVMAAFTYTSLFWLALMIKPSMFARIFTNDPALIEMVIPSLRIFMGMSLFFSLQIAIQQTFIALGNARVSIFLAILRKIILLIPLILIMPRLFPGNPVNAIFFAEPIADTIAVIVTCIFAFINFREIFKLAKD